VLDLDYAEDSTAETDMNIVMIENGGFIELQGTGEDGDFTHAQLLEMIGLAEKAFANYSICKLRRCAANGYDKRLVIEAKDERLSKPISALCDRS
jgi:hypothetical protein